MARDNVNTVFTRAMLSNTVAEIRKIAPWIRPRKDAYVLHSMQDTWFFETTPRPIKPGSPIDSVAKFHTYVEAYNATEARAMGWHAYMTRFHKDAWDKIGEEIS